MPNVAAQDHVLSDRDHKPFYATDAPVEFVLFGYDGDSRSVLAQRSDSVSLSLVGFCMSEHEDTVRVGNRVFHQVKSDPLPIKTEYDDRPKSLKFGWATDRELSDRDRWVVKEKLNSYGLDLHVALTE